jgi:hypothetical protein
VVCVLLDAALMRELESQLSKLVGQANAKWGFDGWSSSLLAPLQVLACLRVPVVKQLFFIQYM